MATANLSGVSQQTLHIQNTTNEDCIYHAVNFIQAKTGNRPANADHVYDFLQYTEGFPHPNSTMTDSTGGTLPTPSPRPIAETLQGWGDVSPQHLNSMHSIFHHIEEKDQRLAYDHFFRELGRAPRVQEFSQFLLTFEGKDLTDPSRKTLGQLYLENKKSQKTLNQILQDMRQQRQTMRLLDSQNQALGQRNDQYKRERDNLQSENRNLEGTICKIQNQKEDLQLKFNSLERKHDQHLAELEDERTDKQQLQADKHALQNTINSQTDTITQFSETVSHLEILIFPKLMSLEPDDESDSPSCDVAAMLELQVSEVEMLTSMFPDKTEFSLDDPTAVKNIQSFLDGHIKYEYLHKRIGFSLRVNPEGSQMSVELVCTFPHEYPQAAPNVFTRCSDMSKENHRKLNEDLHEFIQSLDRGEICMFSVIEWIQSNIDNYVQPVEVDDSTSEKEVQYDTILSRLWIYSHHIFSKFKRRDIIDWAEELKLTGFSLPGKPGVICVEGYSRNVDDYWHRLRGMNWKRIVIKEKEETDIGDDDIDKHRKFSNFEEKVFNVRGGKGREYHMDFGQLHSYLEEHQSGHLFSIYFGVDGKSS
uniref:RWD domain-containing protein 2B n=1 Tax=Magallana gigas TaxID=29159 RepID=K1QLE3_MAGGI